MPVCIDLDDRVPARGVGAMLLGGLTAVSGRDCGQADGGTIAQRRDGFQAHVAARCTGWVVLAPARMTQCEWVACYGPE